MTPDWLPSPLVLNSPSVADDYDKLYAVFKRDILEVQLSIDGFPVTVDTSLDTYLPQFERGFTHIVTCDDGSGGRKIDYSRASKITWLRPIIDNYTEPEVYSFWYNAPSEEVLYLWLADHDFIVILKWMRAASERTKIIVSAFHVQSYNKRYYQRLYGNSSRVL